MTPGIAAYRAKKRRVQECEAQQADYKAREIAEKLERRRLLWERSAQLAKERTNGK